MIIIFLIVAALIIAAASAWLVTALAGKLGGGEE